MSQRAGQNPRNVTLRRLRAWLPGCDAYQDAGMGGAQPGRLTRQNG
jgi:hypothetical protein